MAQTCTKLKEEAQALIAKYHAKRDIYRRSRQTQIYGTEQQFRDSRDKFKQFEDQYRPLCEIFAAILDQERTFTQTPRLQFEHDLEKCEICIEVTKMYAFVKDLGAVDGCHPDHLSHPEWLNRAERPLHAPIMARKPL